MRRTTAASKPTPRWNRKWRRSPSVRGRDAEPDPAGRVAPRASRAAARSRRSGRSAMPRVRANTLVEPPGSGASATSVPTSPPPASLSVPSPASTDDDVDAVGHRVARELGRVAAARRSRPRRRRAPRRAGCARRRHARPGGDRRRDRVHDEQDPHGGEPYPYASAVCPVPARRCARSTARSSTCRACPRLVEWRERVAREKRAVVPRRDVLGTAGPRLR